MDETRLKELEKLAGLQLATERRAGMLRELGALDSLLKLLPAFSAQGDGLSWDLPAEPGSQDCNESCRPSDPDLIWKNAPHFDQGFFLVPPFKIQKPGDRS